MVAEFQDIEALLQIRSIGFDHVACTYPLQAVALSKRSRRGNRGTRRDQGMMFGYTAANSYMPVQKHAVCRMP